MKKIKAYIKAFTREAVTRALHGIKGFRGASFSNVLTASGGTKRKVPTTYPIVTSLALPNMSK